MIGAPGGRVDLRCKMKEDLEKRLREIKEAIDSSAANHHALLGRHAEIMHLISEAEKSKNEEMEDEKTGA